MTTGTSKHLKIARICAQCLFAGAFLYVFLRSRDPFSVVPNPFLRWDPLVFITNPGAAPGLVLPAAGMIVLALALGRVFCSWICPMGGLMELSDFLLSVPRSRNPWALRHGGPRSALVRNPPALAVLAAAIVTAFTGPALLPFVHPNVWIVRVFSLSTLGMVFLGLIVAASVFGRRLWCVYLCPLGALYGLCARVPLPRLAIAGCSRCGACDRCPMQAADGERRTVLAHQCILCFDMEQDCGVQGFRFVRTVRRTRFDPGRRQFLLAGAGILGGAIAGGALAGLTAVTGTSVETGRHAAAAFLRPPGVVDEAAFLRRCLRCRHCIESCPNRIIDPAGLDAGMSSLLTPRLRFDHNGCDFQCQVCQLVCPNQAIPLQSLREKQRTPIGLAAIDEEKCVVFKNKRPCLVCEEVCPTPEKAVVFTREERFHRPSGPVTLKYPAVAASRCIGCGICQANCPADQAAIVVSRSVSIRRATRTLTS
ncbi:MAG: 4Fe-4S binding protein [Spirochaetia bacterium]